MAVFPEHRRASLREGLFFMKHKRKKRWLPGLIATGILLAAEAVFMRILLGSELIPEQFLALIAALFFILAMIVFLLTRNTRHKVRFAMGVLVTVMVIILLACGGGVAFQGINTLKNVASTSATETTDIGVYVSSDDPASSLSDVGNYTFGILATLDREKTDQAVAAFTDTFGTDITVKEYAGLAELMDSVLITGETDAIIANSALLTLAEDMEDYEVKKDQLREIHEEQVETVVEHAVRRTGATSDSVEEADNLEEVSVDASSEVFSVYISGIDSRTGLISRSRSDVNILVTVNTETRQVLLISTPRDFYVPLSISNGVPDKLTHAGIYGIDVCIDTLEMLYQMKIDYYFRVNFYGFEQIIDALGNITVYSDYDFTSSDGKYAFKKGVNILDGGAALAFARERYAFASGDRQRGSNQMAIIKGVIDKVLSPALLTGYADIMRSISGSFETSLPYEILAKLVREQLMNGGDWNVVTYSVDGNGSSQKPYSLSTKAYVMIPDDSTVNHAIELMRQVRAGEILTQE